MSEKVNKECQLVSEHPRLGFRPTNQVGPKTGCYNTGFRGHATSMCLGS